MEKIKKEKNKENSDPFSHFFYRLKKIIRNRYVILGVISFLIFFLVIVFNSQFNNLFARERYTNYKVGMVADRDIIVDRDVIFKDEVATALKREAKLKLVIPVFQVNREVLKKSLEDFDKFVDLILEARINKLTPEGAFLKIQSILPGIIDEPVVGKLLKIENLDEILSFTKKLLNRIMVLGIVDIPEKINSTIKSDSIEIWRWNEGKVEKEVVPRKNLVFKENITNWLTEQLESTSLSTDSKVLIVTLVNGFAREDCFFNETETKQRKQEILGSVEPVTIRLVKGQVIVRKGDIITEQIKAEIDAIGEYKLQLNIMGIVGSFLFLLIIFILLLFLLSNSVLGRKLDDDEVYLLVGLIFVYLVIAVAFNRIDGVSDWLPFSVILPSAAISIVITILISTNMGIVFSLIMGFLVLLVRRMDVYSFLFAFLSGIAGSASVQKAENRIDLIVAGVNISLLNLLIVITIGFFKNYDVYRMFGAVGWAVGNGFLCGILSLGFLPILEQLTNTPTRFKLMELSDLNAPALKRMLMLAPGTYNHSIIVANLAELACREIGANPLIARVGAYYHDIGKVDQAEYFVENQRSFNKHDELKPSLSVAVIKSHVKIGIEKGKELKLPKEIIDIIAQHHGKTLIKYFYQRAKDEEKNSKISPEDYSYPGERPKSREAAVVMLADQVEAASRTLKRPSVAKLERLVWDIIMEKFTSGELSESELTLKDLEVIKNSFVQILAGYFHTRIEYPKINENDLRKVE